MGTDKGGLRYHHTDHRSYLYGLLDSFCTKTFFSCRSDQAASLPAHYIPDRNEFEGPLNGILSAHDAFPEVAWLVVAVDLPFVTKNTIALLLAHRDPACIATVYENTASGLPEPLLGIWEASGLALAKDEMQTTGNCRPTRFLRDRNTKLILPRQHQELFNANTQADYEYAKEVLDVRF